MPSEWFHDECLITAEEGFMPCLVCTKKVEPYWQCPTRTCKLELAYCKEHGGDSRAMEEMAHHIAEHARSHGQGGT